MRRMLRVWVPVVVVALGSGACHIEEVPRPDRVAVSDLARDEINSTLDDYRAALLQGDAAGVAALFTADARLSEPVAPDRFGSRDIRDAMAERYGTGRTLDMTLERENIHVAEGGVAYEMGTYAETFQPNGGEPRTVRGQYAIRWERGPEATWRIHRFLLTYPPADTAATPADTAATPADTAATR